MEKELRTKIKDYADKIPAKDLKKVVKIMERLAKNQEKVNRDKKRPVSFSEACDKLVAKMDQGLTPKIDPYMFKDIASTIYNDQTYSEDCEAVLKPIFVALNTMETAGNAVILSAKFLKGLALYKYTKIYQLEIAEQKFGLKRAQISRYISFFKLASEYSWLVFIDLDFSTLMKNIKALKSTLKNYEQLKFPCPYLQFSSISVDFEAAQRSGNNNQTNPFNDSDMELDIEGLSLGNATSSPSMYQNMIIKQEQE